MLPSEDCETLELDRRKLNPAAGHVPERLAPRVQAALLRERHHVVDPLAAGLASAVEPTPDEGPRARLDVSQIQRNFSTRLKILWH